MEKFNRAVRRHHIARLKAKRKSYWGFALGYGTESPVRMSPRQLGCVVQNPACCSCAMCGNPRRFGKGANSWSNLTMQERGFFQRLLQGD